MQGVEVVDLRKTSWYYFRTAGQRARDGLGAALMRREQAKLRYNNLVAEALLMVVAGRTFGRIWWLASRRSS